MKVCHIIVPLVEAIFVKLLSTIMLLQICMKLMLESSNEDNLVPLLVSLTKLASSSTHLTSELVCSFFRFFFSRQIFMIISLTLSMLASVNINLITKKTKLSY